MYKILLVTQVIISVLLTLIIMVQSKDEGLSATFGGSDFQSTRRGADKIIFRATVLLAALFLLNGLLFVFF